MATRKSFFFPVKHLSSGIFPRDAPFLQLLAEIKKKLILACSPVEGKFRRKTRWAFVNFNKNFQTSGLFSSKLF